MVIMGNVWDRTTEFLSDNLGAVVPLALAAIFIPVSIKGNLQGLTTTAGGTLLVQIVSLLLSLISYWGQLAIVALAINPDGGRPAATTLATQRFPLAVLIGLISVIVLLVAVIPIPVALVQGGVDLQAMVSHQAVTIPPSTGTFVALYAIALVIVLLWLAARLVLISPVVIGERRGLGTFGRSFALTRGLTWRIIGVILLFGIVAIVAVLAAQTVFGSVLRIIFGDDGTLGLASVLTSILVGAVVTILSVLAGAFTAKLYIAARDWRATEAVATA